jgi:hypothetical protein
MKHPAPRSRVLNGSKRVNTSVATSNAGPKGPVKRLNKLTDEERAYLQANNGCFKCRQINVDHVARNCPDELYTENQAPTAPAATSSSFSGSYQEPE